MKKFVVLFTFLITGLSFAQTLKLGAGPSLALPMGGFSDIAGTGIGAIAQGEMGMMGYSLTGSVGYLSFGKKDMGLEGFTATTSVSAIPVLVGAKYSVLPGIYGTAAIGLNFISTSAEATVNYMGFSSSASSTESETKFGYSIGAGAQVMMFDVSLKYQSLASDGNFVALTVLYNIGI